ncbi:serine/threonine-protein kinase [Duganella sp. Dugasp56]|uniref:serine/threonine-protein kinase n=1 Tax=Duganella sp. Dugasp56 TaxID=3243046 RepID=UPI00159E4823
METTIPPATETLAAPAQYQVRRALGEGGYGRVFEAWDSRLQRSVALKQLKAAPGWQHSELLLGEARAAASLHHPAFVKIYALDERPDAAAIVMELVHGRTLSQLLWDGPLAPAEALRVVLEVAEAMQEAHCANLVHGDLKPSNLMREASGRVRVLDFGLARYIDPLATGSGLPAALNGTIAYLAPERLQGVGAAPSSDIYALGVVLYELLTGARPLADLHGLALAAAQLQTSSAQWPFPPQVPAAAAALVRAMTAHIVRARPPSMQAVAAALRGLLVDAEPVALPAPLPVRRRPRYAALAAALLASALLGIVLWRWGDAPPLLPAPFSAATAMQAGLAALRAPDRNGSIDAAVAQFDAMLRREPRHAAAAAGLSLAYSMRYAGDGRDEVWLQRAEAGAQQALKLDDQLALAHAAQAWALEYRGRHDAALAAGARALALDPRNLFALWGRADLLISARRFGEARQAIAAGRAFYPAERIFYDLDGRLDYQRGDYAAAERAFRHSIALEPDAVFAYANLQAALLRLDRAEEGLQVLQQGLQVRPSSRLYTNLGTALFARGDYLGARLNFERAISAGQGSPNKYLYWANLADALRWLPGQQDAAENAYRQAVRLLQPLLERLPQVVVYQSRMGLYLAKLKQHEAARLWTGRALAAAADSAEVHFRAAVAYELGGDRGAALAHVRRAGALGYPIPLIETEPDLLALRRDFRYHQPDPERPQ